MDIYDDDEKDDKKREGSTSREKANAKTPKKQKTSPKKKAQDASVSGKKKAKEEAVASCSSDEEDITPEIKQQAKKYALIRKNSKGRFKWDEQMPKVEKEERGPVRRYAKKHYLPEVKMVTVKDRHNEDIKCPIFPANTVIAEVQLPKKQWDDSDYDQFKWLDQHVVDNLKKEIPDFDPETRMANGKKYTWHHHHEEGKMQLVENGIHSMTQHSGGREIWAAERTSPFDNL
jgi:hypothetical protein